MGFAGRGGGDANLKSKPPGFLLQPHSLFWQGQEQAASLLWNLRLGPLGGPLSSSVEIPLDFRLN